MNVFNPAGTLFDSAPRRRTIMAASVVVHLAFVTAIFFAANNREWAIPARASRALTFVTMLTPPEPARLIPPKPLRVPPVVKQETRIRETVPVELVAPILERVITRLEPAPTAPDPRRDRIVPARPKPAPTVTVGAFALAGNSARAVELSRTIREAEFDAPAARAPQMMVVSAATGVFEQSSAGRPQPGTDRPNVLGDAGFGTGVATGRVRPATEVADAGFGIGTTSAPTPRGGRGLADGGFDAGKADAGGNVRPAQAVKTTDFDTRVQQAAAQAPRQSATDVPLQILSKPTPAYTDEARTLEIEGEVLLDVEFTATGEIHVLKIVRGLGHGLDESAARAVQGMRFKPAQRNGQPIDIRTTVNIVFRLA